MQRAGTEAFRTQIQPSKQKRVTKITNSQNTMRTYGQPSKQLFPKRRPLSNRNRTKNNMNTIKVNRHRNSDTKTSNREPSCQTYMGTWATTIQIQIMQRIMCHVSATLFLIVFEHILLYIYAKKRHQNVREISKPFMSD